MAVAPGSIVKDFDVIEDIRPGQIPGFVVGRKLIEAQSQPR
jgi:hypothetical protein